MDLLDTSHIDEYREVRDDLVSLIEMFPQDKLDEELFDGISIKVLLRNIILAEIYLIAILEDFKEGREIPWEDPYEEDLSPLIHPDSEWEDLYDDLGFSGERILQALEDFPSELWDAKIWKDRNLTPRRLIELDIQQYRDGYAEEISKYISIEEF